MAGSDSSKDTSISVLHVDDEPGFAEMVATHLERLDDRLTVLTEQRAQAGLDRLCTASIDCIVSDYQMPGMDGLEFLEAVYAEYPAVPFILFTGKGSEEVAAEAINNGVDGYVQKDIGTGQFTVLAQQITTLVEKTRAEQRLASIERQTHFPDGNGASVTIDHGWGNVDIQYRAESVSMAVVGMVAEREGVDPVGLTPPLHEVINPEVLDTLIDPEAAKPDQSIESVTFTYRGYTVTVYGDGRVNLDE